LNTAVVNFDFYLHCFSSFVDNSIPLLENQFHRFSISGRFLKISGYFSIKQSRQAGDYPTWRLYLSPETL
ncbi:MAG: hypothetical protein UHG68_07410, partial [Clostridia bacterium]|nr:hypothetical protein [Clostridia bacterium]